MPDSLRNCKICPTFVAETEHQFGTLMSWADAFFSHHVLAVTSDDFLDWSSLTSDMHSIQGSASQLHEYASLSMQKSLQGGCSFQ